MSLRQLKPDIISHILSFLVPRLPEPMSGHTKEEYAYCTELHADHLVKLPWAQPGAKIRDDIRANELAVLMRTSIDMNRQASFHLYRTVLTDSLPSLLVMHDSPPAHPQIESKDQLLRRVRSLHIEYGNKVDQPSYRSIMNDSKYWNITGTIERHHKAVNMGNVEVIELSTMFLHLRRRGPNSNRFPNVRRLSVGAIFGIDEGLCNILRHPANGFMFDSRAYPREHGWPVSTLQLEMGEVIGQCQNSMEKLFRRSPLESYCQRGVVGCLAIPVSLGLDTTVLKPFPTLYTMHVDPEDDWIHAASGNRTRWVLENPCRTAWTTNQMIRNLSRLLDGLDERLQHGIAGGDYKVEIYASCGQHTPANRPFGNFDDGKAIRTKPARERAIINAIRRAEDIGRLGDGLGPPDGIVLWRPSQEAPPCEACEWHFKEEPFKGSLVTGGLWQEGRDGPTEGAGV